MARHKTFAGVKLYKSEIEFNGEKVSLAGCQARIETDGDINRRVTATRIALTGPFAWAIKKKKDEREFYITIEGDGFYWLVDVPPKLGKQARHFTAEINSAVRTLVT